MLPGLTYLSSYATSEVEHQLIAIIDQQTWLTTLARRVQHYGFRYDYTRRTIDRQMELGPLPDWLQKIAVRLYEELGMNPQANQVIINEYLPTLIAFLASVT